MFDLDKWREIWLTLSANKLRTALTAFGVSWGIFMLVIMLGAGTGLQNGVKDSFGGYATNSCYLWSMRTSMAYKGFQPGRSIRLTNEDTRALAQLPEIEYLAPRLQLGGWRGGNNVSRGNKTGAFEVNGDVPENIFIKNLLIPQGRYINQKDIDDERKVAVIGGRAAEVLFAPDEEIIGGEIKIAGVYFQVVGVFKPAGKGERSEREEQSVYIPFSTFQKAFNRGNRVGWYSMTAKPSFSVSQLETKVKALLADRHSVHPNDPRAFGSFNAEKKFEEMNGIFVGIDWLTWFVGIATLLAGAIGISNIMLVTVKERTREFGVRRAIGAKPWAIISQILSESILLTFGAGYFGLVFGILIVEIGSPYAQAQFFKNPSVELSTAIVALIVLGISGLFAGIIPSMRAVSVKPVDALRAGQ